MKKLRPDLPVIDHWWQTESGWPIVANPMGISPMPVKAGSATLPVPGYDVRILDASGNELPADTEGFVAVKLPLPPGTLPTLWHAGYYLSGDGGYKDEDGYVYIMGRIDDVINVAGHRLSTGEMEELLASHDAIAECSVIGVEDELRGQIPVGLVVLKDGYHIDPAKLEEELVAIIRREIGAFAYFRRAAVVKRLPKTRSGKILRHVMRKIADGQSYEMPSTIDDPGILTEIRETMANRKMGKAFSD